MLHLDLPCIAFATITTVLLAAATTPALYRKATVRLHALHAALESRARRKA